MLEYNTSQFLWIKRNLSDPSHRSRGHSRLRAQTRLLLRSWPFFESSLEVGCWIWASSAVAAMLGHWLVVFLAPGSIESFSRRRMISPPKLRICGWIARLVQSSLRLCCCCRSRGSLLTSYFPRRRVTCPFCWWARPNGGSSAPPATWRARRRRRAAFRPSWSSRCRRACARAAAARCRTPAD